MTPEPHEAAAPRARPVESRRHGRLGFRPSRGPASGGRQGLSGLHDPAGVEQGLVFAPPTPGPHRLVLLLHGAGGSARNGLDLLLPVAAQHGLLLLAPKSQGVTWDVITGGYGPDVARIDALLQRVCAAHPVSAWTVGGFSDGASYALSLGLANGDVFDSVVAFSPGFAAPLLRHGSPRIFVSHGTSDSVLPIRACSRTLVPRLEGEGYAVTYQEFDGGHVVPTAAVDEAVRWLGRA